MQTLLTLATIVLYLASFAVLLKFVLQHARGSLKPFALLYAASIVGHSLCLDGTLFHGENLHLGLFQVSSLIFCAISIISLASVLRNRPIHNLLLILIPFTAISVAVGHWSPASVDKIITGKGLVIHIVLSVLAYSLITLAAVQAVMLAVQEQQLRRHDFSGLFRYLPPLQTMEALLFEMIWLGFILLTAAIASGFVFLEDMFAQHLVHKTLLSLCAWCIFAILLFGRHQRGWRGTTATKWTVGGFLLLMLAYFGSKFVLEIILHRV